jgi:hypothetical protein
MRRGVRDLLQGIDTARGSRFPAHSMIRETVQNSPQNPAAVTLNSVVFYTYELCAKMHRFGRVVRLSSSDFRC